MQADALDGREIVNRLTRYIESAINGDDGEVTHVRQTMFERYYGEEYGNERDGYSRHVTREVFETIEWALPSLLRVFMGGVKAVEFSASGPDDEEQAKHETDVVNYWFYDGNPESSGFLTLYSWLKDVLMYPNGYVTVAVKEEEDEEVTEYSQLDQYQLDALQEDPDSEVEVTAQYTGPLGTLYDVIVTKYVTRRRIEVAPAPPDSVLIEHGHTKLDVDSARFSAVCAKYSRSELITEFGYDDAELDEVRELEDNDWNDERTSRLFYIEESPEGENDETGDRADQMFWRYECYVNMDVDGDGVAERRRIAMVGGKIFENEPDDYCPIVAASSIHVTHKHIGMSLAESVADLQELISTLTRQLLDNIYKQNVRRSYVNEKALLSDNTTMDDLLDAESEVILFRGNPAEAIMPEQVQPIIGEVASAIQLMRDKPQLRSGVAPELTLDPSVLKESTMGAFVGAMDQASQRLELLSRLFAETGLKRVFQKIHHLLRTHFDGEQRVKINRQWVTAAPSTWKKRSNMNVNVGLGFNNKQVMVTLLTTLLQIQREAMPAGLADQKTIFNTLEKLIEYANLGHAGSYFIDPNQPGWKPPEPKPDPSMVSAQAQAKSLEADAKRRDAELMHKMAMDKAEQAQKKEEIELRVTELLQKVDELDTKQQLAQADIAYKEAQIEKLNAQMRQFGVTEDDVTADDEFARAKAMTGGVKAKEAQNGKKAADDEFARGGAMTGMDQEKGAQDGEEAEDIGRSDADTA